MPRSTDSIVGKVAIIAYALFLDGIQIFTPLMLVLAGVAATSTPITKATAGAVKITGAVVTKLVAVADTYIAPVDYDAWGQVINGARGTLESAAGAAFGLGFLLGLLPAMAVSFTFGAGFVIWLTQTGALRPGQLFSLRGLPIIIGEFIPGYNLLPLYTILAWQCVRTQKPTEAHTAESEGVSEEDEEYEEEDEYIEEQEPVETHAQRLRQEQQEQRHTAIQDVESMPKENTLRQTPAISDIRARPTKHILTPEQTQLGNAYTQARVISGTRQGVGLPPPRSGPFGTLIYPEGYDSANDVYAKRSLLKRGILTDEQYAGHMAELKDMYRAAGVDPEKATADIKPKKLLGDYLSGYEQRR